MSILKIETKTFQIIRDPGADNTFVWTGLTLGKLMAIRDGLEANIQTRPVSGLSTDLYTCVSRVIDAEAERHNL